MSQQSRSTGQRGKRVFAIVGGVIGAVAALLTVPAILADQLEWSFLVSLVSVGGVVLVIAGVIARRLIRRLTAALLLRIARVIRPRPVRNAESASSTSSPLALPKFAELLDNPGFPR